MDAFTSFLTEYGQTILYVVAGILTLSLLTGFMAFWKEIKALVRSYTSKWG